jgi:hypothetical protein
MGMDFMAFRVDERAIFAVQYALLAISEAAHRLGAEVGDFLSRDSHGPTFEVSAIISATVTTI